MNKIVWTPTGKDKIARIARLYKVVSEYRRKNPDWAIQTIK